MNFFPAIPRVTRTAFVLGAGLGTRLKALTVQRPKPLIPVANKPLITYAFDHLRGVGVERFVVNTHWCSEAYARAFPDAAYRGAALLFRDEQPEVLETAGGIWNARELLGGEAFIVYNGDILSDLPLAPALRATGVETTFDVREGKHRNRLIRLERVDTRPPWNEGPGPSASSAPSAEDAPQESPPSAGADGTTPPADGCAATVSAGVGAMPADDWGEV